ncbi:cytochrome oxidase assembly [Candidatus Ruthia magnifica str. Cm (Calyptogena magnifica)]|uniref:Cytochrome oxidase assembly n=1 Tax=Ruthia magnifica subsp. Calyptogena magnifica TaxID=413404 RepID=A1AV78_RUTMC|nr:COX15/CtaA family protein [Candidatus Ruthturnera calyptogenae]ABL01835.1 cytochrome oxidase assembly [Candidatus Ruthia magnifica str. Cm (Calyptogena magnifica)]
MFRKILQVSIILAFIVVILGAYTRLSDAGLGCPDWPGCYGQLSVPDVKDGTTIQGFSRPLEVAKGWKEMLHRYTASTLGLIILILFFLVLKGKQQRHQSLKLPGFNAFFVILQGVFGIWTVTLLVHPVIVTLHLMGGFVTTTLLIWMLLNQSKPPAIYQHTLKKHKFILLITLGALSLQIALGGWTSTNYAALSCGEYFPKCLNVWWPDMDFSGALYWGPFEINYEYGILENPARSAIQMIHRIGALITTIFILLLIYLFRNYTHLRSNLILITILLTIQITLGIFNVVLLLPIIIAVLHNIVALLLLLSIVKLVHKTFKVPT